MKTDIKLNLPNILLGGWSGLSNAALNEEGFVPHFLDAHTPGHELAASLMMNNKKRGIWRTGVDYNDSDEMQQWLVNIEQSLRKPQFLQDYSRRFLIKAPDPSTIYYNELFHPVIWSPDVSRGRVDLDAVDHLVHNTKIRPDLFTPEAIENASLLRDVGLFIEAL